MSFAANALDDFGYDIFSDSLHFQIYLVVVEQ